MPFLLKADLLTAIRSERLDAITTDDTVIDQVIAQAESMVGGYLNARYDVAAIFSATGTDRDPVILSHCVDVALYDLHALINPRKIPELRRERYHYAKDWLDKVNQAKINPPDLPLVDEGVKDYVQWGSNTKRVNHI